jgi:hypothetical protein
VPTPSTSPCSALPPSPSTSRPPRSASPASGTRGLACDTSPPISSTRPLPGGEPSTWWWIITVQALPDPPRRQAIVNVGQLVGPGGTLLVIAAAQRPSAPPPGPADPWPLAAHEVDALANGDLTAVLRERLSVDQRAGGDRWRVEYRRPSPA